MLKNRLISAVIAGPRTEAHWDSYVDALNLNLGLEDEKLVNDLVPAGHAVNLGLRRSQLSGRETADLKRHVICRIAGAQTAVSCHPTERQLPAR